MVIPFFGERSNHLHRRPERFTHILRRKAFLCLPGVFGCRNWIDSFRSSEYWNSPIRCARILFLMVWNAGQHFMDGECWLLFLVCVCVWVAVFGSYRCKTNSFSLYFVTVDRNLTATRWQLVSNDGNLYYMWYSICPISLNSYARSTRPVLVCRPFLFLSLKIYIDGHNVGQMMPWSIYCSGASNLSTTNQWAPIIIKIARASHSHNIIM